MSSLLDTVLSNFTEIDTNHDGRITQSEINAYRVNQQIKDVKEKYPKIRGIYVEDKANGSAVISVLRKTIPGVIAVNPEGGKVARVNAVSPLIEAGNVWLPLYADTEEFVNECAVFPNGAHDDEVDAMSQALNKLSNYQADLPEPPKPRGTFYNVFNNPVTKIGKGEKIDVI